MVIVADTSVFTICERRRWTALRVSQHLADLFPNELIVIPSLAAAELVQGLYRAKTEEQFRQREAYIRALLQSYSVTPFDEQVAWAAGRVRGEQEELGNTLPLADSLIAATALTLDGLVLTHNMKDFNRIPGLRVLHFSVP